MATRLTILLVIFGASALVTFPFQNCAPVTSGESHGEKSGTAKDKVIGSTGQVTKIEYGPQVEASIDMPEASPSLDVDLASGRMTVSFNGQSVSCSMNSENLYALRDVLANARVCEPSEPGHEVARCMMYVYADIKLSGGEQEFYLRAASCAGGTYLCGDDDEKLRSALSSLAQLGCN